MPNGRIARDRVRVKSSLKLALSDIKRQSLEASELVMQNQLTEELQTPIDDPFRGPDADRNLPASLPFPAMPIHKSRVVLTVGEISTEPFG